MRIWDLKPSQLCAKHLAAEHRELHAIWSVLTQNKNGYAKHPETLRWKNKLAALYQRHEQLVREFKKRDWKHYSPLNKKLARGKIIQDYLLDSIDKQKKILKNKPCACLLS